MATPKREQFANNAVDALNGAIDDVVTSLTVTDASAFPTDGNFRILIDSEIMLVTAVSTNTFTVVRGQEGTTAASHSDATPVTQLMTRGSLLQVISNNIWRGHDDNVPPYGLFDRDGNQIDSSDFTWANQSTATVVDRGNGMYIDAQAGGSGSHWCRGLYLSTPVSTPWSVIALVRPLIDHAGSFAKAGIAVRESSSSKFVAFWPWQTNNPVIETWNSETSAGTETTGITLSVAPGGERWCKIEDDGTNLIFSIGLTGADWYQCYSIDRDAHMLGGANQAGVVVSRGNNVNDKVFLDVRHFSFGG
jgi:hypothetical protein